MLGSYSFSLSLWLLLIHIAVILGAPNRHHRAKYLVLGKSNFPEDLAVLLRWRRQVMSGKRKAVLSVYLKD